MCEFDLEKLRAHDVEELEALFRQAKGRVLAAVRRFARDDADADDMFQGAWVRIQEKIDRLVDARNPVAWCVAVAVNHAKDVLRQRARRPETVSLEDVPEPVDPEADPERMMALGELVEAVHEALPWLPEREGKAVVMRLVEKRSIADTAEALGISVAGARQLVRRGMRKLKGLDRLRSVYLDLVQ